ncbi:hypothetical protein EDB82DRAFT_549644 [Fusarium venenatum]|uniref:uncharacterized protein n=1 Tax=Fusarium venenatum TaxID=56646 RepID=UPI001D3E2E19|nr:hypothetical protein EDB82DRAFT_549644 [Fusarium venenatum]
MILSSSKKFLTIKVGIEEGDSSGMGHHGHPLRTSFLQRLSLRHHVLRYAKLPVLCWAYSPVFLSLDPCSSKCKGLGPERLVNWLGGELGLVIFLIRPADTFPGMNGLAVDTKVSEYQHEELKRRSTALLALWLESPEPIELSAEDSVVTMMSQMSPKRREIAERLVQENSDIDSESNP